MCKYMNIRKIDSEGLLLCNLQAKTFERSREMETCSSEIFIRRFMNSQVAKTLDSGAILERPATPEGLLEELDAQYGPSSYGTVQYTANELYWIGYLYRYFSYTYEKSSVQVYKTVKPKELRKLFLPYHTMDCSQAIERILEAKGLLLSEEEELERQYQIFKKIRLG